MSETNENRANESDDMSSDEYPSAEYSVDESNNNNNETTFIGQQIMNRPSYETHLSDNVTSTTINADQVHVGNGITIGYITPAANTSTSVSTLVTGHSNYAIGYSTSHNNANIVRAIAHGANVDTGDMSDQDLVNAAALTAPSAVNANWILNNHNISSNNHSITMPDQSGQYNMTIGSIGGDTRLVGGVRHRGVRQTIVGSIDPSIIDRMHEVDRVGIFGHLPRGPEQFEPDTTYINNNLIIIRGEHDDDNIDISELANRVNELTESNNKLVELVNMLMHSPTGPLFQAAQNNFNKLKETISATTPTSVATATNATTATNAMPADDAQHICYPVGDDMFDQCNK